jgi:Holliday junction resolvase RusA-like endonuclease
MKGAVTGALLHFRIDAAPAPASRQVGRQGQVFWSKSSALYLKECQQAIAEQFTGKPLTGRVAVVLESVIARPTSSKLLEPRGDVDNYAKHPLDAVKKAGVWGDDEQVVALGTTKRWALPGEEPHANLWIGAVA